jgi:preprotein translocase subunit SecA
MRELERRVVLSVLDRKWREHLYEMDYLKEGIGLRAMAQRDPLVEYKREGFEMFGALLEALKEESVGYLFNVQVQVAEPVAADPAQAPAPVAPTTPAPASPAPVAAPALPQLDEQPEPASRPLTYTGPAEGGGTEVRGRGSGPRHASNGATKREPSRNAPCPCGSGRKYKRCHGAPTTARS